jgi:hypothetical protein
MPLAACRGNSGRARRRPPRPPTARDSLPATQRRKCRGGWSAHRAAARQGPRAAVGRERRGCAVRPRNGQATGVVCLVESQTGQNLFDARLVGVSAAMLEIVLKLAVTFHQSPAWAGSAISASRRCSSSCWRWMSAKTLTALPERAVHLEIGLLREVADPTPLAHPTVPEEASSSPTRMRNRRGLAHAVWADQRHARALRNREANARE